MERGISDRNILDRFAEKFCGIVDRHLKYIVVSGFVAISHGRIRTTEDIDMIIEKISFDKFKTLHDDLRKEGFSCIQSDKVEDIYRYLEEGDRVRYVEREDLLP